jgi:O-antigen/teichoic acid export membrane protein
MTVAVRLPTRALGALSAQTVLALNSFIIQILVSRELGAAGLGTFALLFGAIVMATAFTTGLIGDSLTVLDRSKPSIRAALFRLGWLLIAALGMLSFGVSVNYLPVGTAVLFAVAMAIFVTTDLSRRMLMATLRFWRLVIVDSLALAATLLFLGAFSLGGPLRLNHFIAALATGQGVACMLALTQLPNSERKIGVRGWGDWRAVLNYGSWRAVQQFVRPTTLNAARWIVLIAAGTAAVGELEAARVFVAPAMLLVQGFGSYLFSSYAADRDCDTSLLVTRADRAATAMLIGAAFIALLAGSLLPFVGDWLTGGTFDLSLIGVLGWSCYAASCAAVLPYGSLAAVRGKQKLVLTIRLADSALSLALAAGLILAVGVGTSWIPWILSVGSFVGGLLCRRILMPKAAMSS